MPPEMPDKERPCGANRARPTAPGSGAVVSHENYAYFFTLKKAEMVEPSLAVITAR